MKVLGLLARKGGAGKTTLAINCAVIAQETYKRVLLLDLDPQASSAAWWRAREAETPQLVETTPDQLRPILDAAREDGVDLAVVDTRPSAEADAVEVAKVSDVIAVPVRPAILDLRAILATLDLVKGSKKARIVLNAVPPPRGDTEAPAATDARQALKAFGVPVAGPYLSQRSAFANSLIGGLGVTEAAPRDKAAGEMRSVWAFIQKELGR